MISIQWTNKVGVTRITTYKPSTMAKFIDRLNAAGLPWHYV